ncbi:hypothetical protein C8Q74DRAFT_1235633 [Fomes fomentarius]|nr:hypothetical protein C8Q74DRAFT_1235633 [Fomes fomentarius]
MGLTLPPRINNMPSAENVRGLMARKDAIEAEMEAQFSILKSNSVTMDSPLLDAEGFSRDNIDLWAVRHAHVRIIELRNDHTALMDRIMVALQSVYNPSTGSEPEESSMVTATSGASLEPFARVDGVAPGSPAVAAGLLRENLLLSYGPLNMSSFSSSSLQPLAELVAAQENHEIAVEVWQVVTMMFVPRQGWGGRGLLGCHIVPYSG